jgi:hypothetical protein
MRILWGFLGALREAALGVGLQQSLRRHDEAAARLDAAVKEVLGK